MWRSRVEINRTHRLAVVQVATCAGAWRLETVALAMDGVLTAGIGKLGMVSIP